MALSPLEKAKFEERSDERSEERSEERSRERRARQRSKWVVKPKLLAQQAPDQSGSGKLAPAYLKVAFFQLAYALENSQ